MTGSQGLHHVTAICRDPRTNLHFYRDVLGLRLVKRTVNFDDPTTWHLYYGDKSGSPGTVLTFFPIADLPAGRAGMGIAAETTFAIPKGALAYWQRRLADADVKISGIGEKFGESVLNFADPDGLALAFVERDELDASAAWSGGPVGADHAVLGFDAVTLWMNDTSRSEHLLRQVLGFRPMARERDMARWRAPGLGLGLHIDIRRAAHIIPGRQGAGSVHHIAFRAADDREQAAFAAKLDAEHGIKATEQRDRCYFRSIYFREPSGVLFEIATDMPGFSLDEPVSHLGETLKLPPWLESRRTDISARLLPLD